MNNEAKKRKNHSSFTGAFAEETWNGIAPRLSKKFYNNINRKYLRFISSVLLFDGPNVIGELDLMVVDRKNRIIAIFEVKASVSLIGKAAMQMLKIKDVLNNKIDDLTTIGNKPRKRVKFGYSLHPNCKYYTAALVRKRKFSFFVQNLNI